MDIYQWLLRRNGLQVSDMGSFVYCTGRPDADAIDAKIDVDIHLIPYAGNDDWVEPRITELHACMNGDEIPDAGADCDYCAYVQAMPPKAAVRAAGFGGIADVQGASSGR